MVKPARHVARSRTRPGAVPHGAAPCRWLRPWSIPGGMRLEKLFVVDLRIFDGRCWDGLGLLLAGEMLDLGVAAPALPTMCGPDDFPVFANRCVIECRKDAAGFKVEFRLWRVRTGLIAVAANECLGPVPVGAVGVWGTESRHG